MWRFAPDVDPTTPEIYAAQARLIPTPWNTYRTSPSKSASLGSFTQSAVPNGSQMLVKTDGTIRWITGTTTKLWDSDATGVTWTDRSGTGYSASATQRWQFAQYGNVSLATQLGDAVQFSTAGNFANLAGSPPKAALICTVSNAVLLFNYNDGTAYTDGWWASDIGGQTTWAPAVTNQAANGRLLETPGPITAAVDFNGRAIVFKDFSVYEGMYVGRPTIWRWRVLHRTVGVSSPNAVASNGTQLFFYGQSGAYLYDGANFSRVDGDVFKYLPANLATGTADVVWSSIEQLFCINTGLATPALFAAFCPKNGLWGAGSDAEASINNGGVYVKTPPNYPRRLAINTSGTTVAHYSMNGTAYTVTQSSITTGRFGDDEKLSQVAGVIPLLVPSSGDEYGYNNMQATGFPAQITHRRYMLRDGAVSATSNQNVNTATGRFDVNAAAKWHEFSMVDMNGAASGMTGGMELAGLKLIIQPAGKN